MRLPALVLLLACLCGVSRARAGDTLPDARLSAPLIVADQKGLQKALLEASGALQGIAYPLQWSEFEAASPLLQALAAGAVDTGIAGDGPFLYAWGSGIPVRAAFWLPPRDGGHTTGIVAASSAITSPADLAGRRIATGRGSIGHLLLLRLIQTGAIPAPLPRLIFLAPAQAKAALDSGAVDAWSTWEPYISVDTIGSHAHVVADGAAILPNNGFYVATDTALSTKRAQLADFYRRVARAYAWGRDHEAAWAELLARQTGLPPDIARSVTHKMVTSPKPVTNTVIAQEEPTLDAYRKGGFIHAPSPIASAFAPGIGVP